MTAKRKPEPNYLRGWTMESLWNDLCRARADLLKSEKDFEEYRTRRIKDKADWDNERTALLDQLSAIEQRYEADMAALQKQIDEANVRADTFKRESETLWVVLQVTSDKLVAVSEYLDKVKPPRSKS